MSPEQDALAKVFGGQEVDLYGVGELRQQLAAGQAAGIFEPSADVPDVFGVLATAAAAEVVGTSWETALDTHSSTKELFSDSGVDVPSLDEFAREGIDFAALKTGFEAYETAGLQPEIVFAPVNLPLAKWRQLYSGLRVWQDEHHPSSTQRLKNQSDGDGLYVNELMANNWDSLNQQAVEQTVGKHVNKDGVVWKVLVAPTASREEGGLVVNTSYDLTKGSLDAQADVIGVARGSITPETAHMPIGAYLTAQATHFKADLPPLDKNTTWTWNHGTVTDTNNVLQAPASRWYSGVGQVCVGHVNVDYADGDLGGRLPVWG